MPKKEPIHKHPKVKDKDGLSISYNREELNQFFPHLSDEIVEKNSFLPVDSIQMEMENDQEQINSNLPSQELVNPNVLDFIRRCKNVEDAIKIVDFLFKRNELTEKEYVDLKEKVSHEEGLKKLIEECGGFKRPGYYERKYYRKDFSSQKFKSKNI